MIANAPRINIKYSRGSLRIFSARSEQVNQCERAKVQNQMLCWVAVSNLNFAGATKSLPAILISTQTLHTLHMHTHPAYTQKHTANTQTQMDAPSEQVPNDCDPTEHVPNDCECAKVKGQILWKVAVHLFGPSEQVPNDCERAKVQNGTLCCVDFYSFGPKRGGAE